jgi:hypothetical protein
VVPYSATVTTHCVLHDWEMSPRVLEALLDNVAMVSTAWVTTLCSRASLTAPLPDYKEFPPMPSTEVQEGLRVIRTFSNKKPWYKIDNDDLKSAGIKNDKFLSRLPTYGIFDGVDFGCKAAERLAALKRQPLVFLSKTTHVRTQMRNYCYVVHMFYAPHIVEYFMLASTFADLLGVA